MNSSNEKIRDWLASRLGVSRETPIDDRFIKNIQKDAATGLRELLESLGRRVPPDAKLRKWVSDFQRAVPKASEAENFDISHLQAKTIEQLSPYASVKRLLEMQDAERLLLCIGQNHGSVEDLEIYLLRNDIEGLQRWFAHQNETVKIQQVMDSIVAPGRCRFYIERLHDNEVVYTSAVCNPMARQIIANNEDSFAKYATDGQAAKEAVTQLLTIQEPNRRLITETFMGMRRYINLLASHGPQSREKFIGVQYPGRYEYIQERNSAILRGDLQFLQSHRKRDAAALNDYTGGRIASTLRPSECGLLLIGSMHFADEKDYHTHSSEYRDYDPTYPTFRTDKYLHESGCLKKTNILVLEPHNL